MEDQNVAIRLKGFIDSQGLSHSQFSDRCGIPRPSLSQIISGRNKKVSDVIIAQIHKAFPQLSILWLLFGEGPMLLSSENSHMDARSDENIETSDQADESLNLNLKDSDSLDFDSSIFDESSTFGDHNFSDSNVNSGSDKGKFADNYSDSEKFSNVNGLSSVSKALQLTKKQLVNAENRVAELQLQIENLRKNPRKVTQITVYYDDSTFETFVPKI